MKIYHGIVKKVPTQEQFEKFQVGELDLNAVNLFETVQTLKKDERDIEYINIRLTYKEVDEKGNSKFVFNNEKNEYESVYKRTPILRAYGKEMRVILEMGEYSPAKIVVNEKEVDSRTLNTVVCVQDQRMGKTLNV